MLAHEPVVSHSVALRHMDDTHKDELLDQAIDYVLNRYGSNGYQFWKALIGSDELESPHPNDPGIIIEVSAMWDNVKPGGAIRVLVSLFELRPTRFRATIPTVSFLVFEDGRLKTFRRVPRG